MDGTIAPVDQRYGSTVSKEIAIERMVNFAQHFGEKHLTLACHAAFPLALTPDLLYQIWANFVPQAPWTAVADVLLSPLCREVGHELYEMDVTFRNILLQELRENLGQERLSNLADFLTNYVAHQLRSDDPDVHNLAQAQRWTALVYTRPGEAVHELAKFISELVDQYDGEREQGRAELIRVASFLEAFAEPLSEFEPLLAYARGMVKWARGDLQNKAVLLGEAARQSEKLNIDGIVLSIPPTHEGLSEDRTIRVSPHKQIQVQQVPFINREAELAQIDHLIRSSGKRYVLGIQGPGGIGKTRLLREVHSRYIGVDDAQVGNIIDFDDHSFHLPDNAIHKIAEGLNGEAFEPYFSAVERANVNREQLMERDSVFLSAFVECFNRMSTSRRIVLLFDTADALPEEIGFWDYFFSLVVRLKNTVLLIAGRDAQFITEKARLEFGEDVYLIALSPLHDEAAYAYLEQKLESLHVSLTYELVEKLLYFAGGRPMLVDLAAEQLARETPPDWLVGIDRHMLRSLDEKEFAKYQMEFERYLMRPMARMHTLMDRLILAMSHIYPLNVEMITGLLKIPEHEAMELFREALSSIFVKQLPDGRILLQDEMRRLVNEYVWPQIDPDGDRKRRDSNLAADYLARRIQGISSQAKHIREMEQATRIEAEVEAELDDHEAGRAFKITPQDTLWLPAPFVNREDEIALILSSLSPPCLAIDAPAGYGKTALLQELKHRFDDRQWICAYVSVWECESVSEVAEALAAALQISLPVKDAKDARRLGLALSRATIKRYYSDAGRGAGVALLIDDVHTVPSSAAETLVRDFVPGIVEGLRHLRPSARDNPIRVVLAGRYRAGYILQRTSIPLKIFVLTPFTYPLVREMLQSHPTARRVSDSRAKIASLAAHVMYYTSGHPGCIARVLEQYEKRAFFPTEPAQDFADEIWKTIMRPASDIILRDVGAKYRQILNVLSIFRYLDSRILRQLMDRDLLPTEQMDEHYLIDDLVGGHFMNWKGRFLINSQHRQLLALRLLREEPKTFVEHCHLAKTIYLDKLENPATPNPEIWTVEAIFQSLQQHAWEILSPQRRAELRDSFYGKAVPQALQMLASGRNLQDEQFLVRSALKELEMDEEFRFTVNYYLRKDQYSDEPYRRLVRQISFFFEELEERSN